MRNVTAGPTLHRRFHELTTRDIDELPANATGKGPKSNEAIARFELLIDHLQSLYDGSRPALTVNDIATKELEDYCEELEKLLYRGPQSGSSVTLAISEIDQDRLEYCMQLFLQTWGHHLMDHTLAFVEHYQHSFEADGAWASDEYILHVYGRLIARMQGQHMRKDWGITEDEWQRFAPDCSTTMLFALGKLHEIESKLHHVYTKFQHKFYFENADEKPKLFYLIWKNLETAFHLVRLQKTHAQPPDTVSCPEAILFCTPNISDLMDHISGKNSILFPHHVENLVACYCLLVNDLFFAPELRPSGENPSYPLPLSPEALFELAEFGLYTEWNHVRSEALRRAVLRLNYLSNGPDVYRRFSYPTGEWSAGILRLAGHHNTITGVDIGGTGDLGTQQHVDWKSKPIGHPEERELDLDGEHIVDSSLVVSGEGKDYQNELQVQSTKLQGHNMLCSYDYAYYPFPENRALEVADSRRIARDLRGPGHQTNGMLVKDLVNLPIPHCRKPGTYSTVYKQRRLFGPFEIFRSILSLIQTFSDGKQTARLSPSIPAMITRASGQHHKHVLGPRPDGKLRVTKPGKKQVLYLRGGGPSANSGVGSRYGKFFVTEDGSPVAGVRVDAALTGHGVGGSIGQENHRDERRSLNTFDTLTPQSSQSSSSSDRENRPPPQVEQYFPNVNRCHPCPTYAGHVHHVCRPEDCDEVANDHRYLTQIPDNARGPLPDGADPADCLPDDSALIDDNGGCEESFPHNGSYANLFWYNPTQVFRIGVNYYQLHEQLPQKTLWILPLGSSYVHHTNDSNPVTSESDIQQGSPPHPRDFDAQDSPRPDFGEQDHRPGASDLRDFQARIRQIQEDAEILRNRDASYDPVAAVHGPNQRLCKQEIQKFLDQIDNLLAGSFIEPGFQNNIDDFWPGRGFGSEVSKIKSSRDSWRKPLRNSTTPDVTGRDRTYELRVAASHIQTSCQRLAYIVKYCEGAHGILPGHHVNKNNDIETPYCSMEHGQAVPRLRRRAHRLRYLLHKYSPRHKTETEMVTQLKKVDKAVTSSLPVLERAVFSPLNQLAASIPHLVATDQALRKFEANVKKLDKPIYRSYLRSFGGRDESDWRRTFTKEGTIAEPSKDDPPAWVDLSRRDLAVHLADLVARSIWLSDRLVSEIDSHNVIAQDARTSIDNRISKGHTVETRVLIGYIIAIERDVMIREAAMESFPDLLTEYTSQFNKLARDAGSAFDFDAGTGTDDEVCADDEAVVFDSGSSYKYFMESEDDMANNNNASDKEIVAEDAGAPAVTIQATKRKRDVGDNAAEGATENPPVDEHVAASEPAAKKPKTANAASATNSYQPAIRRSPSTRANTRRGSGNS